MRRIIPVASGKGGVGKTTFAVNFALALSRVAPTALVDLDTGTSSVRSSINTPVDRDLYHFFRRHEPLERCMTPLSDRLDPRGLFKDFRLIAAPRHAIDEITNISDDGRLELMRAINDLPVTYAVLDLRAGLGSNVLDFLPHSNSGILVFTPQHPSATLAAAEIVRALLFRKLRVVFSPTGALAARVERRRLMAVSALLDRLEDSYNDDLPNLDAFLVDLTHAFGDSPLVQALFDILGTFPVYFVLNLFNGVEASYEAAVKPFVTALEEHVSSRVKVFNLGWLVASEEVHRANCDGRPVALAAPAPEPPRDAVQAELDRLVAQFGLPTSTPPPRKRARDFLLESGRHSSVDEQLEVLHAMYSSVGADHVRDNLAYLTRRAVYLLEKVPPDRFGQRRLLAPGELVETLVGPITREDDGGGGATPLP